MKRVNKQNDSFPLSLVRHELFVLELASSQSTVRNKRIKTL
jgi:hypothetical protein